MSKALAHVDLDGHDLPPSPAPSSPRSGRQYGIATQLVYSEGNDQYNASSVPIYQVRGLEKTRVHSRARLTRTVGHVQANIGHRWGVERV